MGYRDDMEAARQRVAVLERELSELMPEGDRGVSLAVEVLELRRRLRAAEERLGEEQERRRRAEEIAQSSAGREQRLASLEESLERVQAELQRRRRVGEGLWRKAAQADLRGREADHLRGELKLAREAAEREARRADVAEVSLIRTQMRLAIERARPLVEDPWPKDALETRRDELLEDYRREALVSLELGALRTRIARLLLLTADLLWNPPANAPEAARELFDLLQEAGNDLHSYSAIRLGPEARDAPGLRFAVGPLAVQAAVKRRDGREVVATIADDAPLEVAVDPARKGGRRRGHGMGGG